MRGRPFEKGHGKLYKVNGMKGKHCSKEHKFKISVANKGRKCPWAKNLPQLFKKGTKAMLGRKHTEISKNKMSIARKGKSTPWNKGKKSYNWIEDRTKLKTARKQAYDVKYKYWMLKVKKRDNWTCKINNKDCNGRLEAHHILSWKDYPELRYNINNGITLCLAHHPKKRAEEKLLIPTFQELISQMK